MDNKKKWLHTMNVYDEYERRFAQARIDKKLEYPLDEASRKAIVEKTKKILKFDEKLMPEITSMEEISHQDFPTYRVSQLRYMTWENFYVSATLYLPQSEKPLPLVFLFCGHGDGGRLFRGYSFLAHRLARMGFAVMVPDNIGQGDREFQGHHDCVEPFYCGLTVQGMIIMESIALIRYMQKDPRFDASRFGSCGNSGGGTLNMFLAALAPELSAISACGYPSEFKYIFEKEKLHCCCNLLPGVMHGPEMWEMFSVFAPKPMLLEQGECDFLFPHEYARRNARKIKNLYVQMDAADNFALEITDTGHSWTPVDRLVVSKFLCQALNVPFVDDDGAEDEALIAQLDNWHVEMPEGSYTAAEAAQKLTGIKVPEGIRLADIYPPMHQGKKVCPEEVLDNTDRGETMRVLAQMECALSELTGV